MPLTGITTEAADRADFRRDMLVGSTAVGVAGLIALLLFCIGLYAVVAFAVRQRTREIGIRRDSHSEDADAGSTRPCAKARVKLPAALPLNILPVWCTTHGKGATGWPFTTTLPAAIWSTACARTNSGASASQRT